MGLTILSKEILNPEITLANSTISSLRANLFLAMPEGALKNDGAIQSINIRKRFGNEENQYDILLTDILSLEHSIDSFKQKIWKYKHCVFYPLLATDYAPSKLSYDFSLAYLRLCPEHLISIYDWVFSLEDIEKLEQNGGWYETWYQNFSKLDV